MMKEEEPIVLKPGEISRVVKLCKQRRHGPERKGFSFDYVRRVLDENDPRTNDVISEVAREVMNARKKAEKMMEALLGPARKPKHAARR